MQFPKLCPEKSPKSWLYCLNNSWTIIALRHNASIVLTLLLLLYLIVLFFTGVCVILPFLCINVFHMWSVLELGLGIEWPEGGSSTNVTSGQEKRRQTRLPPLSLIDALWRVPVFSRPIFISIVATDSLHWLRNMALLLHLHLFASSLYWVSLIKRSALTY